MQSEIAAPVGCRPKVLVVDDEKIVRMTLALIFTAHGYETRQADSAEAALDLLAVWLPDFAILDVYLSPTTSGVDVAERLLIVHPKCRVVLFSGRPETSDIIERARAKTGNSFDLLAKPVHPELLLGWAKGKSIHANQESA